MKSETAQTQQQAVAETIIPIIIPDTSSAAIATNSVVLPAKRAYVPKFHIELDPIRTLSLIGEVGENANFLAEELTQMQDESTKPIYLILSGPGGSVINGAMLIGAIQASRAPVITICVQICASMDAMIHQYGAQRYLTDHSILMFHNASLGGVGGELPKANTRLAFLTRYVNKMQVYVAAKLKLTTEEFYHKLDSELWLDAEDSVLQYAADGIVSYSLKEPARNTPEFLKPPSPRPEHDDNKTPKLFDVKWL